MKHLGKMIELYDHQKLAVEKLKTGSVLVGGVGSGKSITSLYYFTHKADPEHKKNLYIFTTARKRDTLEWNKEIIPFQLEGMIMDYVVDSWNNIKKYTDIENAFVIFDEQRVVGRGEWVKSFLKITKKNDWILLSATPGDTWMDYVPLFIANGYFKNRTEFNTKHVVWKPFMNFPVVNYYINTALLKKYRNDILVDMEFSRHTVRHEDKIECTYDKELYLDTIKKSWNPYKDEPINDSSAMCQVLRRIVNSDPSRLNKLKEIVDYHMKVIIFYNYDYELEMLRQFCEDNKYIYSEWNGHKHQDIPDTDLWVYLVQYTAGAEGWNCISTNTIIFYSLNYSYKTNEQAKGRIDRINTPFINLYYYYLISKSGIDRAIQDCLYKKEDFNEKKFVQS